MDNPRVIATLTNYQTKLTHVLKFGNGMPDFETAKEYGDFAVYYDDVECDIDQICRLGHKCSRDQAVSLFGDTFGLELKHFRL